MKCARENCNSTLLQGRVFFVQYYDMPTLPGMAAVACSAACAEHIAMNEVKRASTRVYALHEARRAYHEQITEIRTVGMGSMRNVEARCPMKLGATVDGQCTLPAGHIGPHQND